MSACEEGNEGGGVMGADPSVSGTRPKAAGELRSAADSEFRQTFSLLLMFGGGWGGRGCMLVQFTLLDRFQFLLKSMVCK